MSSWFSAYFDLDGFVYKVARTRLFKTQFTFLLEWVLTQMARSYFKILLDQWISIHPSLDFFVGVITSVTLILYTPWIFDFIHGMWHQQIYAFTKYAINNYSLENFKKWKDRTVVLACLLAIFHLEFVEINNRMIQIQILQFLVSYFLVEWIQNTSEWDWLHSIHHKVLTTIFLFFYKVYQCVLYPFKSTEESSSEEEDTSIIYFEEEQKEL